MTEIEILISRLRILDLASAAQDDIMALLKELDGVAFQHFTIPVGAYVIRVRPSVTDEPWKTWQEKDLSYVPSRESAQLRRASFAGDVAFYGCTGLPVQQKYAVHVAYQEVSAMHKDPTTLVEEECYMAGLWRVIAPIQVTGLVHHQRYGDKNLHIRNYQNEYIDQISQHKGLAERSAPISTFFADEFAKEVPENSPYLYKLSAGFSRLIMSRGMDGVMYPSVKADADNSVFNVALRPDAVDAKLKLKEVSAVRVIKHENGSFIPLPELHDPAVNGTIELKSYPLVYNKNDVMKKLRDLERTGTPIPVRSME